MRGGAGRTHRQAAPATAAGDRDRPDALDGLVERETNALMSDYSAALHHMQAQRDRHAQRVRELEARSKTAAGTVRRAPLGFVPSRAHTAATRAAPGKR